MRLLIVVLLLAGCGDNVNFSYAPTENCTTVPKANGLALVTCPDGASAVIRRWYEMR